ncbi:CU044_5270 family protein [Nonomuraea typhae]|uniref:CU044_5270 family protein n=1 Tax=Nonomuraea typhae TaxID=2603600 RepID=UPI0012F91220|nr:CU044_5270 family protein [Nonomuraea typhae]
MAAAREALLSRAARRRRRWAGRALAVAAAAVVITVAAAVTQGERPAGAQATLERIAAAVQDREFTAPRPDQWIYTDVRAEDRSEYIGEGTRITRQTPLTEPAQPFWTRADGKRVGYLVGGKLQTNDPGGRTPENTYALLAALPTDPERLLARYREIYRAEGGDDWLFQRIAVTLGQNLVPPEHEAAIFRALAKISGVRVDESATGPDGWRCRSPWWSRAGATSRSCRRPGRAAAVITPPSGAPAPSPRRDRWPAGRPGS